MVTFGGGRKAERTGVGASKDGQTSTYGSGAKEEPEEVVLNVFDFTTEDSLMFDEPTKESYKVFQDAMKPDVLVYSSAFDKVVEVH